MVRIVLSRATYITEIRWFLKKYCIEQCFIYLISLRNLCLQCKLIPPATTYFYFAATKYYIARFKIYPPHALVHAIFVQQFLHSDDVQAAYWHFIGSREMLFVDKYDVLY